MLGQRQWLVNNMFKDLIGIKVEVYINNIIVKSKRKEDHLTHLTEVFDRLNRYSMQANPNKWAFEVTLGKFQG